MEITNKDKNDIEQTTLNLTDNMEYPPCERCMGTGEYPELFNELVKCTKCNGSGYIFPEDKEKK